jgi:hypothetical protein
MSDIDRPYSALSGGRDLVTLVNVFTAPPGGHATFAEAQTGEYRRLRGQVPGSLSANLHVGLDGRTLANVAQYRTLDEYRVWIQSDLMRDHALVIRHLIERSEPGMYRVAHVEDRDGRGVVFVEAGPHPLALLVRLKAEDGARADVLARLVESAPALVREVPGVRSLTVLDGQPIGVSPPPAAAAPRGAVGDAKVAFQGPLVTAYLQIEDAAVAEQIASHPLARGCLSAGAPGVIESWSNVFEVAFVLNDDPERPSR